MCPSALVCPLCLSLRSELKSLVNENGQNNEIYDIAAKYFDPLLLSTVMCVDCWQHIDKFHEFQQSVFNAQSRIGEIEIGPLVKLETVLLPQNDDSEKTELLVKLEPVTKHQDNNDDHLGENMNIPINDSVDSIDYNPFSSDDEIPLTKFTETINSCIKSKKETVDDGDGELSLTAYSTTTQLYRQSKESKREHNATHTEHFKNIHTKELVQYQCLYCLTKCKLKQSIRRHIKNVHPKQFFACSDNESKHFKITEANQTEQGFQCPYCPAKLKIKKNVRRHIKDLHPKKYVEYCDNPPTIIQVPLYLNSTKQAYLCPYCPAQIRTKENVSFHVKKLHANEFVEYLINKPKIIQVDVDLNTPKFSEFIKENIETNILAGEKRRENENISVKDLVNSTDFNPLFTNDDDDDIPLTEYSKTSKLCINSLDYEEFSQSGREFKCTTCGKEYKHDSHLRQQIGAHTENIHQCLPCSRKFEVNIQNIHSTECLQYQCVYCPKKFKIKESVRRHVKNVHPKDYVEYCVNKPKITLNDLQNDSTRGECKAKCSICSKEFKNDNVLGKHMKYKHTEYQCRHCPKKFQERKDLRYHFQHFHPTEFEIFSDYDGFIAKWQKELECYVCKNKFTNFGLLNRHFDIEHPKDKCYVLCCGLKLSYRLALVEHIRFHSDPNFFTCRICGKRTLSGRRLRIHMRTHIQDPQLQCKVCKKYFINKSKLLLHSGIHITEKLDKCKVCGKGFSTELLRKKHELNYHKGKRLCDQCGKSFYNLSSLTQHLRVHAGIRKPPSTATSKFSCEICGIQFKTLNTRYAHKRAFHSDGSKAYVCSECGKMFSSKITLSSHKKTVHTTKRFRCTMCDKEFKYPQSFRMHKARHNLRNLLQCPHCPSKFTLRENFNRHLKIYHPTEYAKISRKKKTKADFSSVKQTIVI